MMNSYYFMSLLMYQSNILIILMSEGKKFPYSKIIELIIREETALKATVAFFKSMQDSEKKNCQAILDFCREIQQVSSKLTSKQLTKLLGNYSIHQTQRNHSEANLSLISQRLSVWLEGALQKLKTMAQKSKRMQSTKQNLTANDIQSFKNELTEQILQVNRLKQSVLNLFCHTMIKNSSMQIQELTSKMQTELQRKNMPSSAMIK